MASKPRDQWSPAYRRRVERAEAQGKTRQEARGHKPPPGQTEHGARRVRESRAGDAQLRRFGATRDDIRQFHQLSLAKQKRLLANQKARYADPANIPFPDDAIENRDPDEDETPDAAYYYHAWR